MTIKLVRLQVDSDFAALPEFLLPPGYEIVWERMGRFDRVIEYLIKGEFPDVFPDFCPVGCRVQVTDTLNSTLAWDWLYHHEQSEIPFRVELPS